MSHFRIPKSASALLPFCRPWHDRCDNPCFESYAEIVVFAAGMGYSKVGRKRPTPCKDFLEQPNPISIEVFKSLQIFPVLLLLGLAVTKQNQIARDDKQLCNILEDYAEVGFREMVITLKGTTPQEMHVELARVLVETDKGKL